MKRVLDFIKLGGIPLKPDGVHPVTGKRWWWKLCWNTLEARDAYWGRSSTWYDGPIYMFGLGRFHFYVMITD